MANIAIRQRPQKRDIELVYMIVPSIRKNCEPVKANLPECRARDFDLINEIKPPSSPEITTPKSIPSDSYYSARQRLVIKDFPPQKIMCNSGMNSIVRFAQKSPEFCASQFYFQYCHCDEESYYSEQLIERFRPKTRLIVSLFWNMSQSNQHRQLLNKIKTVKYEMKLLNTKEEVIYTTNGECAPDCSTFSANNEFKLCKLLPFSMFKDKHFPEDKLIVQVEVLELNGESPSKMAFYKNSLLPTEIVQKHSQNFGSFLQSGQYSNFTVVVKGREFKTHKLVLAAQSPVFAAMLEHSSTKEVREGRLEMTDLDEDVFEQLLEFVYTGRVNDHFVADLFIAANKYQMDSLRTYCDHFMRFNLSDDTVADIFTLAGMFNAPELRERCIRYMIDRFQLANLKNPDDWWKVMESTQLENELMDKFAKLRALNNNNNKRKRDDNETYDDNSSENNDNNNKTRNVTKKCNNVEEEM